MQIFWHTGCCAVGEWHKRRNSSSCTLLIWFSKSYFWFSPANLRWTWCWKPIAIGPRLENLGSPSIAQGKLLSCFTAKQDFSQDTCICGKMFDNQSRSINNCLIKVWGCWTKSNSLTLSYFVTFVIFVISYFVIFCHIHSKKIRKEKISNHHHDFCNLKFDQK